MTTVIKVISPATHPLLFSHEVNDEQPSLLSVPPISIPDLRFFRQVRRPCLGVLPDPVQVILFGAQAVMHVAQTFADLVEQPGRGQNRLAPFGACINTVHVRSIGGCSPGYKPFSGSWIWDVKRQGPMFGAPKRGARYLI